MKSRNNLIAKSEMLIRKPVSEVFEALFNPDITSEFWFTEESARLEPDKSVEWKWGQFEIHAIIKVTEIKQNKLIAFQWPTGEEGSSIELSKYHSIPNQRQLLLYMSLKVDLMKMTNS